MLSFLSMYVSLPLFQLHGDCLRSPFTICLIQQAVVKQAAFESQFQSAADRRSTWLEREVIEIMFFELTEFF